jgi:hypothetical protein
MAYRVFFFVCLFMSASPAMAQEAVVAQAIPKLDSLTRAETFRTIRYAESSILYEMHAPIRRGQVTDLENLEKQLPGFFNRAAFCYRALTLLAEKQGFSNIASIYRARADIYSDRAQGKINLAEFTKREAESQRIAVRTLTSEMASLEKDAPPNKSTIDSLVRLGDSLGQSILASAMKEFPPPAGEQSQSAARTQDALAALVGYGQIARSDGLNVFFVLGSFPTREQCDSAKKAFSDTVLSLTKSSQHSAKIESGCPQRHLLRSAAQRHSGQALYALPSGNDRDVYAPERHRRR